MKLDARIFLYLDFETRSPVDIKACGLENYARSAEVLMLGWAINDGPVRLWLAPNDEVVRLTPGELPPDLHMYLCRPEIVKIAWNASFERAILKYALGIDVPVDQWMDPSAMSRYASGPSHLALASEVFLQVPSGGQDTRSCVVNNTKEETRVPGISASRPVVQSGPLGKDKDGVRLIRMFCTPGKRGHKTPAEAPEDWQKFQDYCKQDVVAERALFKKLLPAFELPERERKILALDQKVNERGIPVDMQFVRNAQAITERERARLMAEMRELTGLENPNSTQQLLAWLRERGYPYSSLGKKWVDQSLEGL